MRSNDILSQYIYLYKAVINYNDKQFPVTQMLSERHTTNFISDY